MSCGQCEKCVAPEGWVCNESGDFFTTGAYANTIKEYDIHGVSFNQKIDSVKSMLDLDTIQILKALICDSNTWDYPTTMEIIRVLDEITSRLSNDNEINNSYPGDDEQ